ncbi:bifunctional riboflavin kinase/FAD synthetase [bacterium]|nr:bifunctional riboflavin kinase/FAD synthetase [bacterium]
MQIVRGIHNLPPLSQRTVIAIGNFDGLHLGHQKILRLLIHKAQQSNLPSLVLTFYPHPAKVLKKRDLKMIQTLQQRIQEIQKFNPRILLIMNFDKNFSHLSSQDFIQKTIVRTLQAQEIIVGQDFHFGRYREGNIQLLRSLSSQYQMSVHAVSSVRKNGTVISSSAIRDLLREGRVEKAHRFLGRPYEINGKVFKGKARGKILGFPTANIRTDNEIIPPGVYLSKVKINSDELPALTNVGVCPTFSQNEINVESYILDFNKSLYGKSINVRFLKKMRDEIKFNSPAELSSQIQKDIKTAKSFFQT